MRKRRTATNSTALKGKATNFRIVNGGQYASVHQKYLGEWAAPLALITAQFTPAEQLDDMQDQMLGGNSVKAARVQYNTHVSSTLVDRAFTTDTPTPCRPPDTL